MLRNPKRKLGKRVRWEELHWEALQLDRRAKRIADLDLVWLMGGLVCTQASRL